MQTWAVIQFPGSNSDLDAYRVFERVPGIRVKMHWHEDSLPKNEYQLILIPGGFSFGDYLRAGAIAKLSNAIQSLGEAIEEGANVIGICNGFQILLEARLLPGLLRVNESLSFISRKISCRIEKEVFPWFLEDNCGKEIELPIAHRFGNYQINSLDRSEVQIPLRYTENVNGSVDQVAGVYRQLGQGSVFGLMPHPERNALSFLKHPDGALFWKNARDRISV